MVSIPEEVADVSPSFCITKTAIKKTSTRKSLCSFTNIFYVKLKTAKHRVESAESKRRAIKVGNILWKK